VALHHAPEQQQQNKKQTPTRNGATSHGYSCTMYLMDSVAFSDAFDSDDSAVTSAAVSAGKGGVALICFVLLEETQL
jgi:hypothetical protein